MTRVRIVTDSTADIPDDLVEELEIGVVYDYINFGTQSLQDKVEISRSEFYSRLVSSSVTPTTAAPGVKGFEEVFRKAGAPEVAIVALHPPAAFSALYGTAVLAAQSFPEGSVTVVDSGQLSMGMGWQAIVAAEAAQAGASAESVLALISDIQPRIRVFAALDTFEYLRRSGRVGWAETIFGTLLRIKPMIELWDGGIFPLDRVRTGRRAFDRLVELTRAMAPLEALAIMHSDWPEGAGELRRRLSHLCPENGVLTVDVTPVIGVHVGPQGLGVAALSARRQHGPAYRGDA
jgi:DegV family protein with EDD domain